MAGNVEYPLRAFWGGRTEPLDACAVRVAALFERLAAIDTAFGGWADPKNAHARGGEFVPTADAVREVLDRHRKRQPGPPSFAERLSFRLQLWNEAVRVTVAIGGASAGVGLPNPNNCLIYLPSTGDAAERLLSAPVLQELMHAVVGSLDADWGCVTCDTFLGQLFSAGRDMVGWLTFLSDRYGALPPLPPEFRVEPLGRFGTCITLVVPGRFTHTSQDQLAMVLRLADLLEAADLLHLTAGR